MAEIKMYVADTIDLIQKWINENNLDYDSIKLQCHSCDNSTSGAVFTVYGREGNPINSKPANCAIFDVSQQRELLVAFQQWQDENFDYLGSTDEQIADFFLRNQ